MKKEQVIKITVQEVNNWLFSNSPVPEHFITAKTKLNAVVPYLHEQFWHRPELISLLNTFNDLFNIPDSLEYLVMLQKVIRYRGLTKHSSWKYIPPRNTDSIQKIRDIEGLGENDARAKLKMFTLMKAELPEYLGGKPDIHDAKNLETVKNVLEKEKAKEEAKLQSVQNDNIYLTKIDQETITEMELTLFNVKLLKKRNEILYTFIDKHHKKKYFLKPFEAEIYVSKHHSVIQNDYLVPRDENFIAYVINDWGLLNKLKFAVNHNYKKVINGSSGE